MKHIRSSSVHEHRGFTLVETLVAIAILMIAIVGPFYSIQQAIKASYTARDQLIASSLAQEGAEYIYFIRNSNYLSGNSWLSGLNNCLVNNSPAGCTVDPAVGNIQNCGSTCSPLKLNTSNNLYTHAGSHPETRFTRSVRIESVSAEQVRVTVVVTWITFRTQYSVTVTENLYNWL